MTSEHDGSGPPLPRPTVDSDWVARLELLRDRLSAWRNDQPGDESSASPAKRPIVYGRLAVWLAVAAVAASAAWFLVRQSATDVPVETLIPHVATDDVLSPVPPHEPPPIVVHVTGAVARPGLVELTDGARVAQAVDAAGGAGPTADLERINLALLLSDEDRVFVPTIGEEAPVPLAPEPGQTDGEAAVIDLNEATPAQLEALPGVGPATAAAIVAYRDDNGPFSQVAGLEAVPGIGPAKLAQMRDLVTVRG